MAHFRTGKDQQIVPFDVVVVGDLNVRTLVVYVPATATVDAYIKAAANLAEATHIVALSDVSMEDNHVAVEYKNYSVAYKVAKTSDTNPTDKTKQVKKVGLYPLFDKGDVILEVGEA